MSDIGGSGSNRNLEKKIALLEKQLRDARLQATRTAGHFGNERRILEGLVRLKEEDIRDHGRLLKASQNRGDRLQNEVRSCRKEMLQRHNERVADQVTIANLRAKNAELIAMLRSLYASTGRKSELLEEQAPALADTGTCTDTDTPIHDEKPSNE